MLYAEIVDAVEKIRKHCGEDDPFRLCQALGILLLPHPFGRSDDAIKGFFLQHHRIRTITYNSDLPEVFQRIIIGHEIGHAQLHARSGVRTFHDVGMFDVSSQYEKDANLFAAELLLRDSDVLEALNADSTFFSAASVLRVPIELLDFKFRVMKWKGCKLVEPPITARSNFLRDVEVPYGADDYDC